MQKEEIISIATKVSEGTATRAEMAAYIYHLDQVITEHPDWEALPEEEREQIGFEMRSFIREDIQGFKPIVLQPSRSIWPRIAVAASILMVCFAGLWIYKQEQDNYKNRFLANDLGPGKNSAILTLTNGRKIKLSDQLNGELAKEAGIKISKTTDGQLLYELQPSSATGKISTPVYHTLTTSNGETYQLRLPDGTLVVLNAASSLTFATAPDERGARKVSLSGEGYFEVFKDKQHPFIVKSGTQEVKVLGTHFNINSYKDDGNIKTTLVEGIIGVSAIAPNADKSSIAKLTILKPDQEAVFNGKDFKVKTVDPEFALAWKNGKFVFQDERLELIMKQISRWYNVKVEYEDEDEALKDIAIGGSISRFSKLSKVLSKLELTGLAKFKLEANKIIVLK
ncbi:FecR family protein [Pedobacter gandavensis]|uniref:FecR family protein n=1 Tax=Pedobacter gandavensis TaxID=2679963 RepID=UPI00292F2E8A|nr:FecR domain-containing protein [Pedobacter gandavensis]